MKDVTWYFDFISPFSYLQFCRFDDLPKQLNITRKPVLFAALLNHWGQKGPAEIPPKRRFSYRFFKWQAKRRGVPFTMPPVHPFNPLPPLRLAIAAGPSETTVRRIFQFIYGEGRNLDTEAEVNALGEELGLANAYQRMGDPDVKAVLRENTDSAIADEVFGLPSFVMDGEVFWGDDATDMFLDYLNERDMFEEDDMERISTMPMGLQRRTP